MYLAEGSRKSFASGKFLLLGLAFDTQPREFLGLTEGSGTLRSRAARI